MVYFQKLFGTEFTMKRSYGISIFTGTLISIVISVSAIYMIMKSGMSVVLNTAVC